MEPTENNVEDQFKAFVRKEVDEFKQRILEQCNKSNINCKDVSLSIGLGGQSKVTSQNKSEMAEKLKQLV
jgi:hypothetical protein